MNNPQFPLKDGLIVGGDRVIVIGEIGLCHDGDLDVAKALIRGCKEAGVDAVKFQKRDVANLTTADLLDAKDDRFPQFGKTYREIREHVEFSMEEYAELKALADDLELPFWVTAFDETSADQIANLGVPAIKLASHVLSRKPLIEHLCKLKIPVVASTGMAYLEEIDETAAMFKAAGVPFGLFHCVSIYPHAADRANLRMIRFLQERYDVPVGYSCHEIENVSSILAVGAGAAMLERHVTLDRNRTGFDHKFALDMDGLKTFVQQVRQAEAAMGTTEKTVSEEEWVTRRKYHCSVVSTRYLSTGTIITRDMLTVKNPGTGIPAREIDNLVGRRVMTDIDEDVLLSEEMLES